MGSITRCEKEGDYLFRFEWDTGCVSDYIYKWSKLVGIRVYDYLGSHYIDSLGNSEFYRKIEYMKDPYGGENTFICYLGPHKDVKRSHIF